MDGRPTRKVRKLPELKKENGTITTVGHKQIATGLNIHQDYIYNGSGKYSFSYHFTTVPLTFDDFTITLNIMKQSNDSFDRPEKFGLLSRTAATYSLCRYRTGQTFSVPDQQLQPVTMDDCTAIQISLADRIVFQMDQTASSDQSFLRYHNQCRQDSGMDCHQCLCAGSNPEKRTRHRSQHVRNSTGFGCHAFRENTRKKSVSSRFQQLFK